MPKLFYFDIEVLLNKKVVAPAADEAAVVFAALPCKKVVRPVLEGFCEANYSSFNFYRIY